MRRTAKRRTKQGGGQQAELGKKKEDSKWDKKVKGKK